MFSDFQSIRKVFIAVMSTVSHDLIRLLYGIIVGSNDGLLNTESVGN